jgi:hypothetical protein
VEDAVPILGGGMALLLVSSDGLNSKSSRSMTSTSFLRLDFSNKVSSFSSFFTSTLGKTSILSKVASASTELSEIVTIYYCTSILVKFIIPTNSATAPNANLCDVLLLLRNLGCV